jgi:hypothetical protein
VKVAPRDIPAICSLPNGKKPKVVFGIPIPKGQAPHPKTVQSLIDSLPFIDAAGYDHGYTQTLGNPYISGARAEITRKGMDAKADIMVYIDYDISWQPQDLVTLLNTPGDVVAGTYRCKTDDRDEVLYMGAWFTDQEDFKPIGRKDGCIKAKAVPAGFLKVTTTAIDQFMRAYPHLCYGPQFSLSVDLFNHGAHDGLWWGEDYAFARNYIDCGGDVWIVPNLNIDHWQGDYAYKGNLHEYLLRQPGGREFAQETEQVNAYA